MTEAVYVVDAVRTPVGRIGGGLAGVRPDDLGAAAVRGLLDRVPGPPQTGLSLAARRRGPSFVAAGARRPGCCPAGAS